MVFILVHSFVLPIMLLEHSQVWVLEELELPVVSISSVGNRKMVLMKSPWEIVKRPAGSGGIFSLLSSNKILETLNEMGVQYTQVLSCASYHLVFLSSCVQLH